MSYAIFTTGGRQFRAEPGVTIKVPLLDAKPGDEVSFDHGLIAGEGKEWQSGSPTSRAPRSPPRSCGTARIRRSGFSGSRAAPAIAATLGTGRTSLKSRSPT